MRKIKFIVIHCSASKNGDARITAEVIDRWHRERGFAKIGYHYVIEVDGELVIGRPEEEIGAHVAGSNANSIGVCMVGTDRFTAAQWLTLRQLVQGLRHKYPEARVLGHRDFSPDKDGDGTIEEWEWLKTCPGFDVTAWIARDYDPFQENVHESARPA